MVSVVCVPTEFVDPMTHVWRELTALSEREPRRASERGEPAVEWPSPASSSSVPFLAGEGVARESAGARELIAWPPWPSVPAVLPSPEVSPDGSFTEAGGAVAADVGLIAVRKAW
ncbi:hypothetical protein PF008_g30553 [Phytophthora fragariae]|uniref:Uncharacterized protein n=1 Tax=Phytophthora fragariae TaxID=53985 RepID=A0A6G0Q5Q7_9STRA|nr:hypothetical protein PF008_g30553 [Phytophthora fragariae]